MRRPTRRRTWPDPGDRTPRQCCSWPVHSWTGPRNPRRPGVPTAEDYVQTCGRCSRGRRPAAGNAADGEAGSEGTASSTSRLVPPGRFVQHPHPAPWVVSWSSGQQCLSRWAAVWGTAVRDDHRGREGWSARSSRSDIGARPGCAPRSVRAGTAGRDPGGGTCDMQPQWSRLGESRNSASTSSAMATSRWPQWSRLGESRNSEAYRTCAAGRVAPQWSRLGESRNSVDLHAQALRVLLASMEPAR